MKIYKYIFNYSGCIIIQEIEAFDKKFIYVINGNERIHKNCIDTPVDKLSCSCMYSLSNDKVDLFKKYIIEHYTSCIADSESNIKYFKEKINKAEKAVIKYEYNK